MATSTRYKTDRGFRGGNQIIDTTTGKKVFGQHHKSAAKCNTDRLNYADSIGRRFVPVKDGSEWTIIDRQRGGIAIYPNRYYHGQDTKSGAEVLAATMEACGDLDAFLNCQQDEYSGLGLSREEEGARRMADAGRQLKAVTA